MCVDIECVEKLKAAGGIKMLQDIVRQEGPGRSICCVKTFAHSCLDNARTAVVIYALQQKVLKTRKPKTQAEAGMVLARAYIRGWRARRAEAAQEGLGPRRARQLNLQLVEGDALARCQRGQHDDSVLQAPKGDQGA
jgi:hypothetical protein